MNPAILRFASAVPRLLALALLSLAAAARAQITAAVAANARYAMEDLKADFRKSAGIEVKTVYGSSGKLTAQIRNGAPFDVFVSADTDFPDSLYKWGYAAQKPRVYAYGALVLWTLRALPLDGGLGALGDTGIARIALADPQRAPYGREAVKALRKAGLYGKVEARLVFGESIAQVNQYVLAGAADVGFTAKSVVLAPENRGKGTWKELDSAAYDPIAQGAVVSKYGRDNNPETAARFLDYLGSGPARAILARYGYVLP